MAQEIAQAVRQSIASEIAGNHTTAKKGPGRPRKNAQGAMITNRAKIGRSRGARRIRRSAAQLANDAARILAYVKGHPAVGSVEIQKEVRLPKPMIASGLLRLREANKIKSKGQRRAMKYTAA